jgi:PAS domain S-box-containing protein
MDQNQHHREQLLAKIISFRERATLSQTEQAEKKRLEKELTEMEETFRLLVHALPYGFVLADVVRDRYGKPTDFEVVDANPAMELLTGMKLEECVGVRLSALFPNLAPEVAAPYREVALTGAPARFEIHSEELDKYFEVHIFRPSRNRLAATVRDVTERSKENRTHRRNEEMYCEVLEKQGEMICRYRPDGTLIYSNPAYLKCFGGTVEHLLGHIFLPAVFDEDRDLVKEKAASLTVEKSFVTYEHRVTLPGGKTTWQEWTDHATFDSLGVVSEYQSVGRDITSRKERETEHIEKRAETETKVQQQAAEMEGVLLELERVKVERDRLLEQKEDVEIRLERALQRALGAELSVCSHCKRIRDEDGLWINLEVYLRDHSEAKLTTAVCSFCKKRHYGGLGAN